MQQKDCVAMVLAGGQGSRLGVLTKNIAKPAVPFGGKYRIIDFTLSNCSNSGIDPIGVLTQYQPLELNSYIGSGSDWDLERKIYLLPPYTRDTYGDWYKGTADAVYQNSDFITRYDPQYVMILSGDHIYKMDYGVMLNKHIQSNAEATISVIRVSWQEARRFGIMNTAADGRIIEFEEKPENPKNNLASMGVYIFNWQVLKDYLQEDSKDKKSKNDFGKNIIPKMLLDRRNLQAFAFDGYWMDVGTIESLWQANMDLLSDDPPLNLHDSKWHIYSGSNCYPPHYIRDAACVDHSIISGGCLVAGDLQHSVLFAGSVVEHGAKVANSVIMPNVKIGKNVYIKNAIVGENSHIMDGCRIGGEQGRVTVVGQNLILPEYTEITHQPSVDHQQLQYLLAL